jgi:hypothetical protein
MVLFYQIRLEELIRLIFFTIGYQMIILIHQLPHVSLFYSKTFRVLINVLKKVQPNCKYNRKKGKS